MVGASTLRLGASSLCGLGLFGDLGGIKQDSRNWPKYVKDRVTEKFACFAGSCVVSALSAAAVIRIPALLFLLESNYLALYWTLGLWFLTDLTVR